ncbi:nucleotidyltransferase domain-containing protein [Spirosoma taeanense]|uniref:Nucleotidyltransferase domain-containing protein n=1 Tax=Spirosoma taeanense TaxID=2735870 RepID=A0A6M5YCN7_9BACT|nr:nucleotidyltransferase domain-containing protein [Spirosoma taeanense]QJW91354.1 nucleotidyltransferase domain-containing protein [Spirosoma taeanense]
METAYIPKALTASKLQLLSRDLKQSLTNQYGDRFDCLVLFGSYARGDFKAESDVDYLVVLTDDIVESGAEIWDMAGVVSDLSDKYDVLISVKPTSRTKYLTSELFLYQQARQEGIQI